MYLHYLKKKLGGKWERGGGGGGWAISLRNVYFLVCARMDACFRKGARVDTTVVKIWYFVRKTRVFLLSINSFILKKC